MNLNDFCVIKMSKIWDNPFFRMTINFEIF